MVKLKTIVLAIAGYSALSTASAHAATSNQIGMAMMRLNSALVDQGNVNNYASGSLWNSLRQDFRMNEVNMELVRRHEGKFAANSAYFNRVISRSQPYMYHIATEVKKRNMPAEIALLPFIESAFVTKAKSHVGASGLWQFMPATGRHYGLEKTPLYDGRHDVYAATDAALNYLEYLHGLFGDWSLALAAYNWGEGNVGRAINRARAQGLEPVYENLRMPNETRNYVPKLLAVRNIVNNPQIFGMNLSEVGNKPYFKAVNLDKPIDIAKITQLAGISESEFLKLNPAFNAPVFIPKNNRKLLLPVDVAGNFEKNYRKANPETLLSWDVYTPFVTTSLSEIAAGAGMGLAELKRLNGISGTTLKAGRSILVAKNGNVKDAFVHIAGMDIDNTPDTYRSNMPEMFNVASASRIVPVNNAPVVNVVVEKQPVPIKVVKVVEKPVAEIAQIVKDVGNPVNSAVEIQVAAVTQVEKTEKNISDGLQTAVVQPLPLPTESTESVNVAENTQFEQDAIQILAEESLLRVHAVESAKNILAQAKQEESAAKLRSAQMAAVAAKQKQRTEARLERAQKTFVNQTVYAKTHKVQQGDTLFNISQRYNVNVADLIAVNNIKGNNIRLGQVLNLNAVHQAKGKSNKANSVRSVSYTVRKGDTLNAIASRFKVDIKDIKRWNGNTKVITPGQRLKLMGS